jgi:hypothetical protein
MSITAPARALRQPGVPSSTTSGTSPSIPAPAVAAIAPPAARAVEGDAFVGTGGRSSVAPSGGRPAPVGTSAPRGLPLGPWAFPAPAVAATAAAAADPATLGATLAHQLGEAAATCIRNAPPAMDPLLVDKLSSFLFTDDAAAFVAAVRRGDDPPPLDLPAAGLGKAFLGDPSTPAFFFMVTLNGRTSSGGMAMFEQDIFPEGFFRERTLASMAPVGCQKIQYHGERAKLLLEQPYFAREGDGYVFKLGDVDDNATLRLVSHLAARVDGSIDLWRGTRPEFDSAAEVLAVQADGRVGRGAMSGFGDGFGSLMTTPDRRAAEGWANPSLVRLSFRADELTDLAKAGLLHAGIEHGYVEMALLYARDPADPRGHDSVARMECVSG